MNFISGKPPLVQKKHFNLDFNVLLTSAMFYKALFAYINICCSKVIGETSCLLSVEKMRFSE